MDVCSHPPTPARQDAPFTAEGRSENFAGIIS